MKKLLFVLLLAWAGLYYRNEVQAWLQPSQTAVREPAVVLYATEWCGYCRRARRFLQSHNIQYVEYDIEKSPEARERYRALGGGGVPVLQVKGRVIHGYNPDAILAALRE